MHNEGTLKVKKFQFSWFRTIHLTHRSCTLHQEYIVINSAFFPVEWISCAYTCIQTQQRSAYKAALPSLGGGKKDMVALRIQKEVLCMHPYIPNHFFQRFAQTYTLLMYKIFKASSFSIGFESGGKTA